MREYRVKVRRKGRIAPSLAAFLLASAISVLILGITAPELRVVADASVMILAVLSLLLFKRFVFRSYTYALVRRDFEAAFDLTVTEQVGQRGRVVCRIGIDDIGKVQRETKKTYRALRKAYRHYAWHDYSMDFLGGEAVLLTFGDEDEQTVIRISFDKNLMHLLSPDTEGENKTEPEQK